ncbi:MAG: hypothetical protein E3J56_05040 [Candidatus Aminicenantes bacterium]|nr:MAG: hypothetical protein E3J56_05040 [Candidatus Aminicenantes bacterium]
MEYFRIAEGEYREDIGSMLETIDAQTAYVSAEKNHIEALANYKIALPRFARNDTPIHPIHLMGLPRFARNDNVVGLPRFARNDIRMRLPRLSVPWNDTFNRLLAL